MNKERGPVIFQWVGTWMKSPLLLGDLNKPLGLGLADGRYDAIFAWSLQIE